jgi:hypothetical protein
MGSKWAVDENIGVDGLMQKYRFLAVCVVGSSWGRARAGEGKVKKQSGGRAPRSLGEKD